MTNTYTTAQAHDIVKMQIQMLKMEKTIQTQADKINPQRNIIRSHKMGIKTLKEHAQELTQQRNDLMQALRAHMHPDDKGTAQ